MSVCCRTSSTTLVPSRSTPAENVWPFCFCPVHRQVIWRCRALASHPRHCQHCTRTSSAPSKVGLNLRSNMSRMCLHHVTTVAREPSGPGPIRSAAGKPSPAVRLTWSLLATRPPPTTVRSAPISVLQTASLHVHRQGPRLLAVAEPGVPSSVQVSRPGSRWHCSWTAGLPAWLPSCLLSQLLYCMFASMCVSIGKVSRLR
jgi:hypothetical protein